MKRGRLTPLFLAAAVLFGGAGCKDDWVTEIPTAEMSMDPYEDLYRLMVTSKMANYGGQIPTRVTVVETVATLHLVVGGSVITIPIAYDQVDIELKRHQSSDKWVVDLRKPDGKLLVRLEPPDAEQANQLAMALATIKAVITEG